MPDETEFGQLLGSEDQGNDPVYPEVHRRLEARKAGFSKMLKEALQETKQLALYPDLISALVRTGVFVGHQQELDKQNWVCKKTCLKCQIEFLLEKASQIQ